MLNSGLQPVFTLADSSTCTSIVGSFLRDCKGNFISDALLDVLTLSDETEKISKAKELLRNESKQVSASLGHIVKHMANYLQVHKKLKCDMVTGSLGRNFGKVLSFLVLHCGELFS
mmetsp:Transcript_19753/g.21973  ORF Transcript_19753/g.21973 Transcript_19753/m.21973 type:complete len:116 (-) Transcript_19753:107-454(-)